MILSLQMPQMGEQMTVGVIEKIYVAEGSAVQPGSRLLDVRVDLSAVAPQDCPPVYSFRIVARERGWVKQLTPSVGDVCAVGTVLALIGTDSEEPLTGSPGRLFRVTFAGILSDSGWLTDRPSS